MKILHLLSQIEITGAEAYAVTLADWQMREGCEVLLISNRLHMPCRARFIPRPIHGKGGLQRLRNILFLRRLIQREGIQIVHCHSRAAVRVAYWATRGLPVAMISSVHGRQHASLSKKLFDLYGDRVITVCENVLHSLRDDFRMNPRKMTCLGNPVNLREAEFFPEPQQNKRLALIARASGPKGERTRELVQNVFGRLLADLPELEIDLIGAAEENLTPVCREELAHLKRRHPGRIHVLGYMPDLPHRLREYQLVLGSGRVPMECLGRGLPTYAIGEHGSEGLIHLGNYEEAKISNFGDIGRGAHPLAINYEVVLREIRDFLTGPGLSRAERETLRERLREDFCHEQIARQIMDLYRSTYFRKLRPRPIPVLMYHQVPDQDLPHARHRIFLPRDRFEKHLRYFRKKGFTTLSFAELQEYRLLRKDPREFPRRPLILTFDDGYADNLTNAAPLLEKYKMKATLFLLADPQVRNNYWDADQGEASHPLLSPAQRRRLSETPFEIGSHGFRHEILGEMDPEAAFAEMAESKKSLENEFGREVHAFAYTFGKSRPEAARWARRAGYDFAVNTDTGGLHLEENPYGIFRTPIFPEDGVSQLRKKTAWWYRRYFYFKRGK